MEYYSAITKEWNAICNNIDGDYAIIISRDYHTIQSRSDR